MRTRRMAVLLAAGGLAAGLGAGVTGMARLSNDNHVPLVALPCDGFQDAEQLLELG